MELFFSRCGCHRLFPSLFARIPQFEDGLIKVAGRHNRVEYNQWLYTESIETERARQHARLTIYRTAECDDNQRR